MVLLEQASGRPPHRWDLRRRGWQLCDCRDGGQPQCSHVTLHDGQRLLIDNHDLSATRCSIVPGVGDSDTRARRLARGCDDVLAPSAGLAELEARARRVAATAAALPRTVHVGPLLLDLLHRGARRGPTWLGLHPREFGLLWHLAEEPGTPVTRRTLLQDVWRIHHEPDTSSVEVHVSRLRGKLAVAGCADLARTANTGGYRLEVQEGPVPAVRQVMRMAMSS